MFDRAQSVLLSCVVFAVLLVAGRAGNAAEPKSALSLPLKKVVVFNTGVAYCEHRGEVEGSAEIDMQFDVADVNDLLKSMVLEDAGGGRISTVSCDALAPITETLQIFSVDLTNEPTIGDLLRQIRGERVTVDSQPQVEGIILGIELRQENMDGHIARREILNLLTDKGLRSIDLGLVHGIQLANQELDAELRRALTILATGASAATTPSRAPIVIYTIMKTTATTTTHSIENSFFAPTCELVKMLPGPMTTHAVISPGPIDWNHRRRSLMLNLCLFLSGSQGIHECRIITGSIQTRHETGCSPAVPELPKHAPQASITAYL